MIKNIIKCEKCNSPLIQEELKSHRCFTKILVDAKFDMKTKQYHVYDGKKWYRWFPKSDDILQLNEYRSSDDKLPEPNIGFCIIFGGLIRIMIV